MIPTARTRGWYFEHQLPSHLSPNQIAGPFRRSSFLCYARAMTDANLTQLDKFKVAGRDFGCDDDETRFDERMKKLVKHKPAEKPE